MLSKCIIVVLMGILGILIGKYTTNKIVRKSKYAKDLMLFSDYIKNEMSFKQTKLTKIIEEYKFNSSELKDDINTFIKMKFAGECVSVASLFENDIKSKINGFFDSLGRFDIDTQIDVVDSYRKILHDLSDNLELKTKKEVALYVKLGFLFGICLGVIMI